MTEPLVAEASRHGRRPVVLYHFMLATPPAIPEGLTGMVFEDTMKYADLTALAAGGWTITQGTNVAIEAGVTNPIYGANSVRFAVSGASGTVATLVQAVSGLAPGATAWATYQWWADGHWFEPMSVTIQSGSDIALGGANPPRSGEPGYGEKLVPSIVVAGSGIVTITMKVHTGYPTISHADQYVFGRIRLFVSETEEPPEIPTVDYFRTSFRRTVTYQSDLYLPCEIEHTEPSYGSEDAPGTIQITLPSDDPISQEFLQSIPPPNPMVAIYEYHRPPVDEPDISHIRRALYDIVSAEDTIHGLVLTCASILGQMDSIVPSGLIQRDFCDFATYHPETCGVSRAAHTFEGTVSNIDGLSVTVPGAAAFRADIPTYFRLGDFSKGTKHTMIREQDGDTVVLDEMIPGLVVDDTVQLVAGDDRTKETCYYVFNNSARRRSFPGLPTVNPYYGRGLAP